MNPRLSVSQRRALLAIERMTVNDGEAHDASGDLSLTSGNWPATASALRRRGLVDTDWGDPIDEFPYYTLTPLGRGALRDIAEGVGVAR